VEASQRAKPETELTGGHTVFEYELHRFRAAELLRRAEHERLARAAVRGRRAARREEEAHRAATAEAHTDRPRRHRFARAA
jgi:hypothetical protein